jgi:preprotein translocase subunit YajC
MDWLIQDAWAQELPGSSDPLISMLPLLLVFVVFYFLLIRPQNKRQKEHKEMVAKLGVGDEVVTSGGVLGKVTEMSDQFLHLEVADGVVIKIQRHTIGAVLPKGTIKGA